MSGRRPWISGGLLLAAVLALGLVLGAEGSARIASTLRAGELARLAAAELQELQLRRRYSEARPLLKRVAAGRTVLRATWMEADGTVRERSGADLPHPEPPEEPGVSPPREHQGVPYRDVFARLEDGSWLHLSLAHRTLGTALPTALAAVVVVLMAWRIRRRAPDPDRIGR